MCSSSAQSTAATISSVGSMSIWGHPLTRQLLGGATVINAVYFGNPLLGLAVFCMFMAYEYRLGWK
jgi:hypothetical protein